MKALVQRVLEAAVTINESVYSQIGKGFLVFLGVEKGDTQAEADFLAKKIANLRIFEDENGKMNLSILDVKAELLIVSQFTLPGDTSRGNRPGFETAAKPEEADALYLYMIDKLKSFNIPVQTGVFQTDMKVKLINDGPCTFILERKSGQNG